MGDLSKRAMLERILADVDIDLGTKIDQILAAVTAPRFRFKVGPVETLNLPQGIFDMAITLKDNQHVSATLQEFDAVGNPVPTAFDTPPTWSSSDPTVLAVTPSADGTGADIAATGKLGSAQVRVDATNDAGQPIIGLGDIDVVAGPGTTVGITFGTPVDK